MGHSKENYKNGKFAQQTSMKENRPETNLQDANTSHWVWKEKGKYVIVQEEQGNLIVIDNAFFRS